MNLLNKIMLSCAYASELIEKQRVKPLSRTESVQLFFHTRMCGACRSYELQSSFIDQAFKKVLRDTDEKLSGNMLKAETFIKIIDAIKKE